MYVLRTHTYTGIPEVPIALPAPTLSQVPLTQFTQQDHPSPVIPPSQPSTITSILAPDSLVSSQSSTHTSQSSAQSMPKHLGRGVSEEGSGSSSTTSDVTVKINETVMHRAKSSHQDVCGKPISLYRKSTFFCVAFYLFELCESSCARIKFISHFRWPARCSCQEEAWSS